MKKVLSIIAVLSIIISGCDKVLIPQQQASSSSTTNDTVRKILIEDFTGHFCQNCPGAARMIDSLEHTYPGQVIGIGIHINEFAQPYPEHAPVPNMLPGTFTEDFRVSAENADYDQIWQTSGYPLPQGFVNRFPYSNFLPTGVPNWPSAVATIIPQPMTAYIKIHPDYDTVSRVLNVDVSGLFMCDTTGTYNVVLYLVEDGIVGSQVDGTTIDNNYTFHHVFRGCINTPGTIGGQQVATGTITNGQVINYTMTTPFTVNTAFNAANCKIVGFIQNMSDHGILQAAECDLY
jgi:hypothetical protein